MILDIINPIELVLSKTIIVFGFKQYIKYGKFKNAMIYQMRYHNNIKKENKLKKRKIYRERCQLPINSPHFKI